MQTQPFGVPFYIYSISPPLRLSYKVDYIYILYVYTQPFGVPFYIYPISLLLFAFLALVAPKGTFHFKVLYMYVCMCIRMYVCMYIYIYVLILLFVCPHYSWHRRAPFTSRYYIYTMVV
jgi:hypothetical protein